MLHNTVEIYGRAVTFDIHRVCDRPPLYSAHYDGVWPLTRDLDGQEGQKLVLKTYALRARVTSSITHYEQARVSVGARTSTFSLQDSRDSRASWVYFDLKSVELAIRIADDSSARCISPNDALVQHPDVRSQFHKVSTYLLCRASGFFTMVYSCPPFTCFTLADADRFSWSDVQAGALFQRLAWAVCDHGWDARLKKRSKSSTANVPRTPLSRRPWA